MTHAEKLAYHSRRASQELDRGLSCSNLAAARAHLKLSSMHFERVREIQAKAQVRRSLPLLTM
jgi:hypothetical protein